MKPRGPLAITTVDAATPSQCIALILMATDHQRIWRRILGRLHKKETQGPPIKDSLSTIREAVHQIAAVVTTEAHTHSDLRTACSTIVRPIIPPKTAPYSSSPREKWTRDPTNFHQKQHPEKSITSCNGLPTTSNILHLTLHISHHKPIKTTKLKPRPITNHTTTQQPGSANSAAGYWIVSQGTIKSGSAKRTKKRPISSLLLQHIVTSECLKFYTM
jgi:hypothetical protein